MDKSPDWSHMSRPNGSGLRFPHNLLLRVADDEQDAFKNQRQETARTTEYVLVLRLLKVEKILTQVVPTQERGAKGQY